MVFQNKYNSEGLLNKDYHKEYNNQDRSDYYATSQELSRLNSKAWREHMPDLHVVYACISWGCF